MWVRRKKGVCNVRGGDIFYFVIILLIDHNIGLPLLLLLNGNIQFQKPFQCCTSESWFSVSFSMLILKSPYLKHVTKYIKIKRPWFGC